MISGCRCLCNCHQSTVINLKFGGKHGGNCDISIAPKLEGKYKIPHFSRLLENVHPDSNVTAPRNASILCAIYLSIRSFLELLIKAGGWVVYFAPMIRFTPPSPLSMLTVSNFIFLTRALMGLWIFHHLMRARKGGGWWWMRRIYGKF